MRTLAIGDIHGCHTALETLLKAAAVTSEDFLIFLGDYIDRGPDSKAAVSRVIQLLEEGNGVALRGNHELMILAARKRVLDWKMWRFSGGDATLRSYQAGSQKDWRTCVPETHWNFFEGLRPYFETPTHIFVHASVVPSRDLPDQPDTALYWEHFDPQLRHKSGKTVICGHTMQASGWPVRGARAICLDTGAFLGEWLTGLDVDSGRFWQANERAAVRSGELPPP